MVMGNQYQEKPLTSDSIKYMILAGFIAYCLILTIYEAHTLRLIHYRKKLFGYKYDPTDLTFSDNKTIIKVVIICHIAGILGGVVGIAGGIILGPVFLTLGMLPQVTASTNQYLAMISTISVTSQFLYMGVLNIEYSLFLGIFVCISAFIGLTQVNRIVKITGRQSIIVITLSIVLFVAFFSLPAKYILT